MAGRGDRFAASVLSFGVFLPAALAAGAGLGWLGDRFFHTFPVLTALGALAGFAAGIRQLLREAKAMAEPAEPAEPAELAELAELAEPPPPEDPPARPPSREGKP